MKIEKLNINGDKLYQKRARKVLPVLVRQAEAREPVFYGNLAEELGIPNPRNMNFPLWSIGKTLQELGKLWKEEIPAIQCLVVNQNTGLPGEGISDFISNKGEFRKLSKGKKDALVRGVQAKVFGYDKWDSVLEALGLDPALIPESVIQEVQKSASSRRGGSGEGKEHKRLKQYIENNPRSIGIEPRNWETRTEEDLPSGDFIDVSFKKKRRWVGVEVKSRISDAGDIQRGLYQCVKYQAVMEAYLSVKGQQTEQPAEEMSWHENPKSGILRHQTNCCTCELNPRISGWTQSTTQSDRYRCPVFNATMFASLV